jgi:hypothetical protein
MSNFENIMVHMKALPCCECGKSPSHTGFIKPVECFGPKVYFNLMPLCTKHCIEHEKIGTMELVKKYRNVRWYIEKKGWEIGDKLWHRDLKES